MIFIIMLAVSLRNLIWKWKETKTGFFVGSTSSPKISDSFFKSNNTDISEVIDISVWSYYDLNHVMQISVPKKLK